MPRLSMLIASLATLAFPVLAEDAIVEETRFVVVLKDPGGDEAMFASRSVPLMPGRACYIWAIQLAQRDGLVKYRETFTLPEPPKDWGGEGDPNATNQISPDRLTSVNRKFASLSDGWFGNQWCVTRGDPLGPHSIEVHIGEQLLERFEFELVRP